MEAGERPEYGEIDALEMWRCPQLGGPVTFEYCRVMNDGLPCPRTVQCWMATFDVVAHLQERFSAEELEKAFGEAPKDRMTRIVDALKRTKGESKGRAEE